MKKFSWQTEVMAGVRGPSAFAKQTQTFFHDAINYQRPMGWENQLPDKLILNINMVAEKGLAAYNNWLEMIGGAQVMAGTLVNNVGVYSILRLGKMSPYFNGIMQQFSSASGKRKKTQTQAYIILKPAVILNAANSLLNEGAQSNNWKTGVANVAEIKRIVYRMSGGFVFTINKVSLSVTQQVTSALMKNMYSHEVGNVSLYVSM